MVVKYNHVWRPGPVLCACEKWGIRREEDDVAVSFHAGHESSFRYSSLQATKKVCCTLPWKALLLNAGEFYPVAACLDWYAGNEG